MPWGMDFNDGLASTLFMVFMTKTSKKSTGGHLIYGRVSHKSVRNNVAQ